VIRSQLPVAIPSVHVRLQLSHARTDLPSEWHRHTNTPSVDANRPAIDEGGRRGRERLT